MIEQLRGEVFSLNEKLNCFTKQVDRHIYRRNCRLIHGITKSKEKVRGK